jgi:hypothetical protein
MTATLGRKIYRLHLKLTRRINDTHIFLQKSLPNLKELKTGFSASKHKKDRRYYTPKLNKKSFARRKDGEVAAIFERFLSQELFETLLVASVSHFEAFLAEVVAMVLRAYPKKLSIVLGDDRDGIGKGQEKHVSLDAILKSDSYEALIERIIVASVVTLNWP